MIGNFGIGSLQAMQAAAAVSVCTDVRPCFACALEEFGKETAAGRDTEREKLFQLFCVLLKQYVNTFGAAMLSAQGVSMTVVPDSKRSAQTARGIERYTATEVAGLLRGFALFYLQFKVDVPDEFKDAWWQLTWQLAAWLTEKRYAPGDFQLDLSPSSDEAKINAVCASALINEAAPQFAEFDPQWHELRAGEPFYLVSRSVPGKLWFLFPPTISKVSEFGPVPVPPAVANFIKPGWALDCRFVNIDGRWRITCVQDVLPI